MATLTVPKADKGFYLNFTVQNSDGTAFDLTGYTVTFKVWSPNKSITPIVSGACVLVVAASGTCRYSVAAADFAVVGIYNMELELTQVGVIESTKLYSLEITESPP